MPCFVEIQHWSNFRRDSKELTVNGFVPAVCKVMIPIIILKLNIWHQ